MITIRKAEITEWPLLQNLNNEVFEKNKKYDTDIVEDWAHSDDGKEYFENLVKDPESICLVAINENNQFVGFIAGSPKAILYKRSKYFEIDNMGVAPGFRFQGIGKRLVEGCIAYAKEKGYQKISVSSYSQNIKATEFYEKCGFTKLDINLEREI